MPFPTIRVLAFVLGVAGAAMMPPLAASVWYGEGWRNMAAWLIPAAASWTAVAVLWLFGRGSRSGVGVGVGQLEARSAFRVVGGVWVAMGLFGAIPLLFCGAFPSFTDAVFESVSGFTTTGASVATDVEALPHSVNLWRCLTHWLGGMGVIALAVALVPLLGVGGFRLIKAETTGPEKGRVTPRIADTAKALWAIYATLTAAQAVMLHFAGLGWFDAICHSFSTLGTGGFSTRNASVGAFANPAVEWICTVFMLAATVNFALYYKLATRKFDEVFRDSEFRSFLAIVAIAITGVSLAAFRDCGTVGASLRHSSFQVASIISTTGFMTADYAAWSSAAQVLLFALFFIGGCSGSTAGGIKIIRWTVLAKQLRNELRRIIHPREVMTLRINGLPGREEFVPLVAAFVFLYLMLVLAASFAGALAGLGLVESISAALSMAGNIGPAFGQLGPTANYAALPDALKWFYSFTMLAGRLEIYTMLILVRVV